MLQSTALNLEKKRYLIEMNVDAVRGGNIELLRWYSCHVKTVLMGEPLKAKGQPVLIGVPLVCMVASRSYLKDTLYVQSTFFIMTNFITLLFCRYKEVAVIKKKTFYKRVISPLFSDYDPRRLALLFIHNLLHD